MVVPVQQFKLGIFVLILLIIAVIVFSGSQLGNTFMLNLVWIALFLVFVVVVLHFDPLVKLKDYERGVIFRFGKVNRVGGPGWCIVWPWIETYTYVDLRTKTLDVARQDTITKDSIEVKIDAVIYLKVRKDNQSVINSVIEVENFQDAARTYVIASIRDIAGSMDLMSLISNIEELNSRILHGLVKIADEWGVRVISVEIKDIDIPKTVLDAMHEQKAAVQQKLARIERAQAQKAEIDAVKEAAEGLSDKAMNYYYIKALEEMARGRGTKMVFPLEFASLAKSIGASFTPRSSDRGNVAEMKALIRKYEKELERRDEKEKAAKEKAKKKKKKGKKE